VQAGRLQLEMLILYLAWRDSRTPRSARMLAMGIVGYALSPIDLIPDPVPFIGYLDDVGILLLGLAILPRMIPSAILADCRTQARGLSATPVRWVATSLLIANWLITAMVIGYFSFRVGG
jgi:uncharacterized membrane protein YkvA (DUF1232 family)